MLTDWLPYARLELPCLWRQETQVEICKSPTPTTAGPRVAWNEFVMGQIRERQYINNWHSAHQKNNN